MPKKGKGANKKKQSRKNKSSKPQKRPARSKTNASKSPKQPPPKREGQAFSKQILQILNQMTGVLREVGQLKGSPLYETVIKLDELCDDIIRLQSGDNAPKQKKRDEMQPRLWGFEDVRDADAQTLLNRLTLWVQREQPDSLIGDKFELKAGLAEGRGVVALKDLGEGELVMSIDRKLMMTETYALTKSDEQFRRFLQKDAICKLRNARLLSFDVLQHSCENVQLVSNSSSCASQEHQVTSPRALRMARTAKGKALVLEALPGRPSAMVWPPARRTHRRRSALLVRLAHPR